MKKQQAIIVSMLLLPLCLVAHADDKTASHWDGTNVSLGGVDNSGDSNTQSFTGSTDVIYTKAWWNNAFNLSGLYSQNDSIRSSQSYTVADTFKLSCCPPTSTKTSYLLAQTKTTVNAFNAYKYTSDLSFGYGNDWIKNDKITLSTSIAPGYNQSAVQGTDEKEDSWTSVADISATWNITKTTSLQEGLAYTLLETYWKTDSTTSLSSTIAGNLSLKLSYNIIYISKIPDGSSYTAKTNKITTINLVYNF